jgi:hypothetical protein
LGNFTSAVLLTPPMLQKLGELTLVPWSPHAIPFLATPAAPELEVV